MRVIDKILTRHFVAFMDIYDMNAARSRVGNAYHMIACGIKSGIVEGLTLEELENEPDIKRITEGDFADLANEVGSKIADALQSPDPN